MGSVRLAFIFIFKDLLAKSVVPLNNIVFFVFIATFSDIAYIMWASFYWRRELSCSTWVEPRHLEIDSPYQVRSESNAYCHKQGWTHNLGRHGRHILEKLGHQISIIHLNSVISKSYKYTVTSHGHLVVF